jgi:hypothetical protein
LCAEVDEGTGVGFDEMAKFVTAAGIVAVEVADSTYSELAEDGGRVLVREGTTISLSLWGTTRVERLRTILGAEACANGKLFSVDVPILAGPFSWVWPLPNRCTPLGTGLSDTEALLEGVIAGLIEDVCCSSTIRS